MLQFLDLKFYKKNKYAVLGLNFMFMSGIRTKSTYRDPPVSVQVDGLKLILDFLEKPRIGSDPEAGELNCADERKGGYFEFELAQVLGH